MLDSDETDETGVVVAQLLSFLREFLFLSMEEADAFADRIGKSDNANQLLINPISFPLSRSFRRNPVFKLMARSRC